MSAFTKFFNLDPMEGVLLQRRFLKPKNKHEKESSPLLQKIQSVKIANENKNHQKKGITLVTVDNPFNVQEAGSAFASLYDTKFGKAFYYHDHQLHQIVAKFDIGTASLYKERSNIDRGKLKPIISHAVKGGIDKTHVIPIGYHGSEKDERLVVGWDSKLNRQDMRLFEDKVKRMNESSPIAWMVSIELQPDKSAIWYSKVMSLETAETLEQQWHDTAKFTWNI